MRKIRKKGGKLGLQFLEKRRGNILYLIIGKNFYTYLSRIGG
jgi:hypothetical protein